MRVAFGVFSEIAVAGVRVPCTMCRVRSESAVYHVPCTMCRVRSESAVCRVRSEGAVCRACPRLRDQRSDVRESRDQMRCARCNEGAQE